MASLLAYLVIDPLIIITTAFFGTLSVIGSLLDSTGAAMNWLARKWAKTILFVSGIKVKAEGLEYIDPKGSFIFAVNHLSYMDTPVIMATIPMQFRFLAKRGLFKIPLLGTHLAQAGHIPVPLEDARASVKTLQMAAKVIQEKRISLLIFPEGGRAPDGILQPFKEGAAYIAIKAGVPIVPVTLIGTWKVIPFGSGVVRPGPVSIQIDAPIPTTGLTLKDRGALTDQIRHIIQQRLSGKSPEGVSVAGPGSN